MIDNNTKLGIFSYFGYELAFHERILLIKNAGFSSTFIWLGPEEDLVTKNHIDDMPKIVREEGLQLEAAHASYTNCSAIWSSMSTDSEPKILEYEKNISFCSKHGIPILVIHVTSSKMMVNPDEHGIKNLQRLVRFAENHKTIIAIENAREPQTLDYIFEEINSPYLKICYDSSHDFIRSKSPAEILRKLGTHIVATHFSDNDGLEDRHWLPIQNNPNWSLVKHSFPRESYSGSIMLEVIPGRDNRNSPEVFLKDAYNSALWLKALLKG